ncbi:ABC transporter permease [Sphaerisporangium rufum]|uniref:ABC transporter permease n=1 Tax=Sphaerisporangium rufum TaxID=1381558 RepID=A0A919R8E7_9ACTN|nr:ABC-2 family transporter protein [Sphaerisporangium rufum]GII80095.1 ABC transporter permease [Sphaerisporangium rufum]
MKVYLAIARVTARSVLAYRGAYALGIAGSCFQLLATTALWTALLAGGASIGGFDLPEMKAYLLVGFATGLIGTLVGDWVLANRIRDGQVALDLVKPIDTQKVFFAQNCGGLGLEIVFIAVVSGVFVLLAGPMPGPADGWLFAASLAFVLPIRFGITFLTTMLVFWTENHHGVVWARDGVAAVLSGAIVPLAMMPGWLQSAAAVLPFAGLTSTPALIYLGKAPNPGLLIAIQAGWAVALWYLARFAFRGASRQITIHGG